MSPPSEQSELFEEARRVLSLAKRIRRNPFIQVRPTVLQMACLAMEEPEVLFTGTGGCGKSVGLLMAALGHMETPGYSALLVEKTNSGPGGLRPTASDWLGSTPARWDGSSKAWRFPLGAKLAFGHERMSYTAGEYQFLGVDDLTLLAEAEYRRMFGLQRNPSSLQVPLEVRVATCPGGPGHDWVRERFSIDDPVAVLDRGRRVLSGTMEDNPYLDVEAYRESLAWLDPIRRAQLELGDWTVRPGGNMFRREWFRVVDRAPAGLKRVRFWDLAATEEPELASPFFDPDWRAPWSARPRTASSTCLTS